MELPGATEGNVVVRFPPEASGLAYNVLLFISDDLMKAQGPEVKS